MSTRRVLVPPSLPLPLPMGGGHLARRLLDFSGTTMGTHWQARVIAPPGATSSDLERVILDALAFVVARMSPWEPDSDLGRFRAAAAGEWVAFAPETFRVLARALELAALTNGRYEPAIGRLADVLGFGPTDPANAASPGTPVAADARAVADHTRLRLDSAAHAVLQPGGFQLDLCSIAKGFAVDLVVERLRAVGVEACFIEIGGEARGLGCRPDGNPWWCLIAPPRVSEHGLPTNVVAACGLALATSGNTLRRRALPDGSELGHILSARPDAPLDPALESVTILASSCMEADACATALYVLGAEAGLEFARRHDIAALFVEHTPAGWRERWSPRFAEHIG